MDGEKELKEDNTNSIVAKIDKALDEYEGKIGLNKTSPPSEAEQYLGYSHADIQRMSAEHCGEAAILLAQFGFHIQKHFNAEMARVNWAEEEVRRVIANETTNYNGSNYEERKLQAIRGNDYARKIDAIRSWAKCRAERLSYIASKVEFLARTFLEMQQTKRRMYGQQG